MMKTRSKTQENAIVILENLPCENEKDEKEKIEEIKMISYNRGTGAGGSKTNHNGLKFEEKTNSVDVLLFNNYVREYSGGSCFYVRKFEGAKIIFTKKGDFKRFVSHFYGITSIRDPDEAYIIEYDNGEKVVKILEKKNQNVAGSVETKLWAAPSLKREFEIVFGKGFKIEYGFCLNNFYKKKINSKSEKYKILVDVILNENNIDCLFGDDDDYFDHLVKWITKKC